MECFSVGGAVLCRPFGTLNGASKVIDVSGMGALRGGGGFSGSV